MSSAISAAARDLPLLAEPEPAPTASPTCGRCERLPLRLTGAGRLFLWFPMGHTRSRAVALLRRQQLAPVMRGEDQVMIETTAEALSAVSAHLAEGLTSLEAADTRTLFLPGDAEPGAGDVPRVETLTQLTARSGADWLVELLAAERLTSHYQPIVHTGDVTRVFAHEALLRGLAADGSIIPPGRMFGAATAAGLLFQLDLAARRSAIGGAIRRRLPHALFVNFTPTAIYDPNTCLRTTVRAIDEGGLRHDQVVFEVIESDRTTDPAHLQRILAFYRDAGFRVALDDVGSGYSSLNLIHQLRPDFIKLDMQLMRGVHADPYKAMVAAKLLELAAALGIESVAEGIETEEELAWAREHGATYAQGFLIGRPS